MTVLLDSSAFVKLVIDEPGTDDVSGIAATGSLAANRLSYPEVRGAIARARASGSLTDAQAAISRDMFEEHWAVTTVLELDAAVALEVGRLVDATPGLRASDAVHLATAIALGDDLDAFATWDRRLHIAARSIGVPVFPSRLEPGV